MDKVTDFKFPAIVNGVEMIATVLSEEGEGRDFYYRVRFSDEYEDVFHVEGEQLQGLKGPTSQPYADAIKNDVHHFIAFNEDKFWYVFQDKHEGDEVNVWVFEEEEEDEEEIAYTSFNVFYKKKYRFHLTRAGDQWMLSTRNETPLTDADREIVTRVEDMLIALL